jgi:hypothetical protein
MIRKASAGSLRTVCLVVAIACVPSLPGSGGAQTRTSKNETLGPVQLLTQSQMTRIASPTPPQQGNSRTNPSNRKIQVFIVGVPSWKVTDNHYDKDTILGGDIQDTCLEIRTFFSNRFGHEVQFHPANACTPAVTTREAIRHQLEFEMPHLGKGTLTFVFMMSHGQSVRVANSFFGWDTEFLTSDATDTNLHSESISIDFDLMSWLKKMSEGSTALVFVDSCNSGAVDNPAVQMEGTEESSFAGVTLGLMVASTSHQGTYDTAFTRSLLALWKSGQCPAYPMKIEQYLQDEISKRIGGARLVGYDGRPEPIVRYAGGWCLSQLGAQGRLLFLYQGSNNYLVWKIINVDHPAEQPIEVVTDKDAFDFQILQPGTYKIEAENQEGKTLYTDPDRIDFVNNSTLGVFFPGEQITANGAERAMDSWANAVRAKGLPQADVARVQEAADQVSAYLNNGVAPKITAAEADAEMSRVGNDAVGLRSLGDGLIDDGRFAQASRVLVKAAKATPSDSAAARGAATEAFLAAGLAGDPKAVQNLDKKYPSNLNVTLGGVRRSIVSNADAARAQRNPTALERLKAVSAMTLASLRAGILAGNTTQ